jgi:hypothetical protein
MGFAPAEVTAGLRRLCAELDPAVVERAHGAGTVFSLAGGDVRVTVAPLPEERRSSMSLSSARTLLTVHASAAGAPLAAARRRKITLTFLRVTG